jgi:hypothetical protein
MIFLETTWENDETQMRNSHKILWPDMLEINNKMKQLIGVILGACCAKHHGEMTMRIFDAPKIAIFDSILQHHGKQ